MRYLHLLCLLWITTLQTNAQGICDSTITISHNGLICSGSGIQFHASLPGGVFSGPGIDVYGVLPPDALSSGDYMVSYSVSGPGGCINTTTMPFTVDQSGQAIPFAVGSIDCGNPNSTAVLFAAQYGSNAVWIGPYGTTLFTNPATTSVAGHYRFYEYLTNPNQCPDIGIVDVDFHNMFPIHIQNCTDCSLDLFKIGLDTLPPITFASGWQAEVRHQSGLAISNPSCVYISEAGKWRALLYNTHTGCMAKDSILIPSVADAVPTVSAGAYGTLPCGITGQLLGAVSPNPMLNAFWTTTDGHFAGPNNVLSALIDKPGTYTLHVVNTYTGCGNEDSATIEPAHSTSSSIAVICAGESYSGYTQSGTYIDTVFTHPDGCFEKKILKLLVLPQIQASYVVTHDDGTMNGAILVNASGGSGGFNYYWSTNQTGPAISGLTAGTYTVTIVDANACEVVKAITVPLGFQAGQGEQRQLEARIIPNPSGAATGERTLFLNSAAPGEAMMSVVDALGRTIFTHPVVLSEGENLIPLYGTLQAGMYWMVLSDVSGLRKLAVMLVENGE